jgi:hypothetical protein
LIPTFAKGYRPNNATVDTKILYTFGTSAPEFVNGILVISINAGDSPESIPFPVVGNSLTFLQDIFAKLADSRKNNRGGVVPNFEFLLNKFYKPPHIHT